MVKKIKNRIKQKAMEQTFASGEKTLQWVYRNTPFAIQPKSKFAKSQVVKPFTSNHAFEEVCKHLAKKLYEELQDGK